LLDFLCRSGRIKTMSYERIKKLVNDYVSQRTDYRDFAETVRFVVEKMLKLNSFNYQVATFREKDPLRSLKNCTIIICLRNKKNI